jgi:hypothetical protein
MKNLLRFIFLVLPLNAVAQTPFTTSDSIDVGNINARMMVHGDLWTDPITMTAKCEFPKGSGLLIGFGASLWLGGYDSQHQLHVSAQQFRTGGVDFWPGPLDSFVSGAAVPVSYQKSQSWARLWKVERWQILSHINNTVRTISNTPPSILEWPGAGNIYAKGNSGTPLYLTSGATYAPFVDVNNNSIYDPLQGDYPDVKGDQAILSIFNDLGPTHASGNGVPIGVEVQCLAYAYHRNTTVDNVIFYEYMIRHVSSQVLDSFVVGLFADLDIGYCYDDYVGFDSSRNLGYMYNAVQMDSPTPNHGFGDSIPMSGVRVLQWDQYDTCGVNTPAGSFMYAVNGNDHVKGDPRDSTQYYNYLRGRWRNGQQLAAPFNDPVTQTVWTDGTGLGSRVFYAFDSKPYYNFNWAECAVQNVPFDRRMIFSGLPQTIVPGSVQKFAFALVASPRKKNNGCPNHDLSPLQAVSDTAKYVFCNPLPIQTAIGSDIHANGKLVIFPNPACDRITVSGMEHMREWQIVDAMGRRVSAPATKRGNEIEISTDRLSPGVYHLIFFDGMNRRSGSFLKY